MRGGVCEDAASLNDGTCPLHRRVCGAHWRHLIEFVGGVQEKDSSLIPPQVDPQLEE